MRKGDSVKGYKFISKIGRGASGDVWECEKGGKLFAVKCIPLDDETAKIEETYAKRNDLNSPFLVKYYEAFRDTDLDLLFIVMEICRGGDLSKTLKVVKETHVSIGLSRIMRILIQSLLGLRELHIHKLLHRDLKPQNMFVDENCNTKLGDFGTMKPLATQSNALSFKGTLPYISPEMFLGNPYNENTDVWSLGVVLYQLAALELPWVVRSELEYSQVVVSVPIKPLTVLTGYPQVFIDIVHSFLQKDPAKRAKIDDVLKNTFVQSFAEQFDLRKHFPPHLQAASSSALTLQSPSPAVVTVCNGEVQEKFEVNDSITIAELKELIAEKKGVDVELQNLFFAGLLLDDEHTLSHYKVPLSGAKIYLLH